MLRTVSKLRDIKPDQRKIIAQEAKTLNGNLESQNGFDQLRSAVSKKCGIIVNNILLRRVLKQQDLMARQKQDEPRKDVRRPKHKRVHVRPPQSRMCSK